MLAEGKNFGMYAAGEGNLLLVEESEDNRK
jgi:hypothetical protein